MHTLTRFAAFATVAPMWAIPSAALVFKALDRMQQRRALARLDTRGLDDIGLSRKEALAEARRPFWKA